MTGPAATPEAFGAPDTSPTATTDGRQLRRERNREAVVEALLDLYRDGVLQPSSEEIAERSGLSPRSLFRYFDDVEDLVRAAIGRQQERAIPLIPIDAEPEAPLETKITALVEQRFRLFEAVGNAAAVMRLRSHFQPLLADRPGSQSGLPAVAIGRPSSHPSWPGWARHRTAPWPPPT